MKQFSEAMDKTRDLWSISTPKTRIFIIFMWIVTVVAIVVGFVVVLAWKLVTSWRFWVGIGAAALMWIAYTLAQIY